MMRSNTSSEYTTVPTVSAYTLQVTLLYLIKKYLTYFCHHAFKSTHSGIMHYLNDMPVQSPPRTVCGIT